MPSSSRKQLHKMRLSSKSVKDLSLSVCQGWQAVEGSGWAEKSLASGNGNFPAPPRNTSNVTEKMNLNTHTHTNTPWVRGGCYHTSLSNSLPSAVDGSSSCLPYLHSGGSELGYCCFVLLRYDLGCGSQPLLTGVRYRNRCSQTRQPTSLGNLSWDFLWPPSFPQLKVEHIVQSLPYSQHTASSLLFLAYCLFGVMYQCL